ncbi:MAG: hypothetical protein GXO67_05635 [Archaeoglobi archaeon]|nr:hypothetical protein [Archaeoglobi archaeon]
MGFSTTAAFTIIFVFSLAVFGLVYSIASDTAKTYVSELREKKDRIEASSNTRMEFLSVTATNATATSHNLTVVLKNTGTTTLNLENFDLIVDGIKYGFDYNRSKLYPETAVEINAYFLPGGNGTSHRLKVVADNGYALYTTYVVT